MRKIKKLLPVLIILFIGLGWYLFIKSDDYTITFKEKASLGTLHSSVEEWNYLSDQDDDFSYEIIDETPFTFLKQKLKTNNLNLILNWNFNAINDSITQVKIKVSEPEHSIYNRITAPFFDTKFKKTILNLAKDFKKGMDFAMKTKFKVHRVSIDIIPEIHYAYVNIKDTKMRDKASKMSSYNALILEFLAKNNIQKNGYPLVKVTQWNLKENIIDYEYCFPIKIQDSLPKHDIIKFGKTTPQKALKVIYNGNYITSDRGWYAIHQYAEKHQIKIDNNPIEIFYNNPFTDRNELEWVAEVYMPIK